MEGTNRWYDRGDNSQAGKDEIAAISSRREQTGNTWDQLTYGQLDQPYPMAFGRVTASNDKQATHDSRRNNPQKLVNSASDSSMVTPSSHSTAVFGSLDTSEQRRLLKNDSTNLSDDYFRTETSPPRTEKNEGDLECRVKNWRAKAKKAYSERRQIKEKMEDKRTKSYHRNTSLKTKVTTLNNMAQELENEFDEIKGTLLEAEIKAAEKLFEAAKTINYEN